MTTAHDMAEFVKKNNLDGIDIDYEDLELFKTDAAKSVDWLIGQCLPNSNLESNRTEGFVD